MKAQLFSVNFAGAGHYNVFVQTETDLYKWTCTDMTLIDEYHNKESESTEICDRLIKLTLELGHITE